MDAVEILVPIAVCVVLPVLIVLIIGLVRKNETNRKAEVMLKAIEAGVPIDPELFKTTSKRTKTLKDELLEKLNGACITSLMGIALLTLGIVSDFHPMGEEFLPSGMMLLAGSIMLAVGFALFVSYFVGKKLYSKELNNE